MDASTAQAEARRIRQRALDHRQQAGLHRRRMRSEMARLSRFIAECKRMGIDVVLEDVNLKKPPQSSKGEQSGRRDAVR